MAGLAQGDAILYIVAVLGMIAPALDVVRFQVSAMLLALLARVAVALENGLAPFAVVPVPTPDSKLVVERDPCALDRAVKADPFTCLFGTGIKLHATDLAQAILARFLAFGRANFRTVQTAASAGDRSIYLKRLATVLADALNILGPGSTPASAGTVDAPLVESAISGSKELFGANGAGADLAFALIQWLAVCVRHALCAAVFPEASSNPARAGVERCAAAGTCAIVGSSASHTRIIAQMGGFRNSGAWALG